MYIYLYIYIFIYIYIYLYNTYTYINAYIYISSSVIFFSIVARSTWILKIVLLLLTQIFSMFDFRGPSV